MLLPMRLKVDIWHNLLSSNKGCVWSKPSFKKTCGRMLKKNIPLKFQFWNETASIFISGEVLLPLWSYRPAAMSSSTQLELAIRHNVIGILNIELGPFLNPIWPCQDKGVIIWNSSWGAQLILQNIWPRFWNPLYPPAEPNAQIDSKIF